MASLTTSSVGAGRAEQRSAPRSSRPSSAASRDLGAGARSRTPSRRGEGADDERVGASQAVEFGQGEGQLGHGAPSDQRSRCGG